MPYDRFCLGCTYNNQTHLINTQYYNASLLPIELENNSSFELLILQAPRIEEWKANKPIQPTTKKGGTGGARIMSSWIRCNVKRTRFDIVNAVQCYPGCSIKGDLKPDPNAICSCNKRLLNILRLKRYTKIITLGDVAYQSACCASNALRYKVPIISGPHPNSRVKGVKTSDALDALW